MKKQEIMLIGEPQRAHLLQFIANLNLAKPFKVTIEEHRKARTLNQNALYWKWVNEVCEDVAEHTGHTADEMHEFFKHKFLPPRLIEVGGETFQHYTTTKLTVAEMSEYMTRVHAFVTGELGIYVTLPEERFAA